MDSNGKPRINVLYTSLYGHEFVNCNGLKISDYTKFQSFSGYYWHFSNDDYWTIDQKASRKIHIVLLQNSKSLMRRQRYNRRTCLVSFECISGDFGRAMIYILARRSRDKIPMAKPNEPDMLPELTKKGRTTRLVFSSETKCLSVDLFSSNKLLKWFRLLSCPILVVNTILFRLLTCTARWLHGCTFTIC